MLWNYKRSIMNLRLWSYLGWNSNLIKNPQPQSSHMNLAAINPMFIIWNLKTTGNPSHKKCVKNILRRKIIWFIPNRANYVEHLQLTPPYVFLYKIKYTRHSRIKRSILSEWWLVGNAATSPKQVQICSYWISKWYKCCTIKGLIVKSAKIPKTKT